MFERLIERDAGSAHCIEQLIEATEGGKRADSARATEQVKTVLRARRLP